MPVIQAYGLAALSGVLYFLAFAGFDLWPLAFVALVPLMLVLERAGLTNRQAIAVGWLFGFITNCGGYYWLVGMLQDFSGFPLVACLLFAAVVCLYQAGQLALFFVGCHFATRRGYSLLWIAAPIYAATERCYPLLFPSYYANCFHQVPWLTQVVDLGGPTLLSGLAVLWNTAALQAWQAARHTRVLDRRSLQLAVLTLLLTLGYGAYRIDEVTTRAHAAPQRSIGVVQADMGLFQKRQDPEEGHRRHIEQSLQLEHDAKVDLLVWPESSIVWGIPGNATHLGSLLSPLRTPVLFGGIARRDQERQRRVYNTAFMTDAQHDVIGTYDKTYLLAFGEYLPFGEALPWLYELSPNTGHFTPGNHQRALPFGPFRIGALICYEDVLPSFTRDAVLASNPHLLVNMTNDSWFGDTHEPWIHLALAKFRAIEHHRYLVRATNSGVSAIIDASGRVVTSSRTFERASIHADVAMLTGNTLYELVGDWPGWTGVLVTLWLLFARKRPALATDKPRTTQAN